MGVVVSETTSDTPMAAAMTTANSRNSRPATSPMNRMGMKTATSDRLIETTVKAILRVPSSAASRGLRPCLRWRTMFSSTTTASSTTKPVATVSAISDRLSSV
ncbi:MAG: hypothetical protein GAK30_01441 [Paracidovorax wautersii]|uniref:Uncharacterized protein n=1 Tax=Paracidovorax wautersii TaxID=1177982 RepID=A0A7V8FPS7_9BURK|nr:MAG: hypothetical protein GAK30_01441 [Paracidovorax wautersii]